MNIREIFKNDAAKSAFKVVDDVTRVCGKYGEIEIIGNMFDIWFVDRENGLSQRKITALCKKLPRTEGVSVANGEIWYQTRTRTKCALFCRLWG